MRLLSGHHPVDDYDRITGIKERRVPVGRMHPVSFFWGIEPLYIAVCMRMASSRSLCSATIRRSFPGRLRRNFSARPVISSFRESRQGRSGFFFARFHDTVFSVASISSGSAMNSNRWCSVINSAIVSSKCPTMGFPAGRESPGCLVTLSSLTPEEHFCSFHRPQNSASFSHYSHQEPYFSEKTNS